MSQFDKVVDRRGTSAEKLMACKAIFGREDVIPMWVADMDLETAPEIVEALKARAAHGIFGYTGETDEDYDAIIGWLRDRFGAHAEREWIMWSPNVVSAIRVAVNALTLPGDRVVIATPVYTPFFSAVRDAGRIVRTSAMLESDGFFTLDYEDIENAFRGGARMMVMCSPHNPVGRVWTRAELERLVELCRKYDVILVSDEIHDGFIFKGHRHHSVLTFDYDRVIMLMSASKSFNLAGLGISNMIVPRADFRKLMGDYARNSGVCNGGNNVFGSTAQRTAYAKCGKWLDELTCYLEANVDAALERMARTMPLIKCKKPEGTYLMWLDARALGEPDAVFKALCEAGVGLNRGESYGEGAQCAGYLRLNVACPRAQLEAALDCMEAAYRALTSR